jgi:histidinol-phosphatase
MPRDENTSLRPLPQPSLAEDLALARRLAELAARIALDYQRRGVVAEKKADGSVVTEADREVERALRAIVAAERPEDAMLGEELGASGESSRRWIFDPIDGTSNFVGGKPEWGNHIALEQDGRIVLGIITRPLLGRLWWATRGGGAHRAEISSSAAPVRIRVSTRSALREARVSLWAPATDARVVRLKRDASWQTPNLDAVLRVAEGELEAVVDPTAKPWDHAPGVIIVEEAGGRFSDRLGGSRIDLGEGRFSNGHVHAELVSALDA